FRLRFSKGLRNAIATTKDVPVATVANRNVRNFSNLQIDSSIVKSVWFVWIPLERLGQKTSTSCRRRIFRVSSCSFCKCLFASLSVRTTQFCNQVFGFLFDLCIQILAYDFQKNLL